MRLPYHNRGDQIAPDAMHTIKDSIEKIVALITGKQFYVQLNYDHTCVCT